ncbi:unnamed protein product [Bursaphelenchus xylophilus]|uniref:(pine wood nematode) hypothetical protein n=1 Tax=Bursaphelenchus xylophilus TaxID=6326 RepID=A0A1I7RRF4_BURXY|nr:unnamed protein product [Bursaphelenchus xylophilus]CAG9131000.1 unnamed protein product [Bursaphelenchus xylophilus]
MEIVTESPAAEQPFEMGQDGDLVVPERLISDWIEMALLGMMITIGAPLNAMTLFRLERQLRKQKSSARTKQEAARTSFTWLKIHLTVIDLIVILIYCPSHIGWLISYTWNGGEFMCKAVQYAWDFCFHLMSFGVVGIAVDRLRTVYRLMHMEKNGQRSSIRPNDQLRFVRRLIMFCYMGAAMFSVPQWFVWTTVDMKTWSQCTTIWHKLRALQYLHNQEIAESYIGERLYTMFHLLTVFWFPFIILFVAYLYIVVYLFCYSLRPYSISTGPGTLFRMGSETDSNLNLNLWQNAGTPPNSCLNGSTKTSLTTTPTQAPAWRTEMRSKMFRTTVYVIAAYLICWMPYNVLALATFFSGELQILISMHLELIRVCVLLNTVLNPFIYGFRDSN